MCSITLNRDFNLLPSQKYHPSSLSVWQEILQSLEALEKNVNKELDQEGK
jgi:hypothetical protein